MRLMADEVPALLADIGGTNARFALASAAGEVTAIRNLATADHASLLDAARAYLAETGARPTQGAFAVAGPVSGDEVRLTNLAWRFSVAEVRDALGFERLALLNDFEAQAMALPALGRDDLVQVGGGTPEPRAPKAVLGPGTGLGVGGLVPGGHSRWLPVVGEGGHVTLAAANDGEAAVIAALRQRFGHVSAERALSGPGLVNLYRALGGRVAEPTPADVTQWGLDGSDLVAERALQMFQAMLGTVAGNLALTLGARGGVYIAGGIVPRFVERFAEGPFRARFEGKGRFADWLAEVPTYVVLHEATAFIGLARAALA